MIIKLNDANFENVSIGKIKVKTTYDFATDAIADKYYQTGNNSVGERINLIPFSPISGLALDTIKIPVEPGDSIYIKVYGGGGGRAYGFGDAPTDQNPYGTVLEPISPASYDATAGVTIIAPANAVNLFVTNNRIAFPKESVVIEVTPHQ